MYAVTVEKDKNKRERRKASRAENPWVKERRRRRELKQERRAARFRCHDEDSLVSTLANCNLTVPHEVHVLMKDG